MGISCWARILGGTLGLIPGMVWASEGKDFNLFLVNDMWCGEYGPGVNAATCVVKTGYRSSRSVP